MSFLINIAISAVTFGYHVQRNNEQETGKRLQQFYDELIRNEGNQLGMCDSKIKDLNTKYVSMFKTFNQFKSWFDNKPVQDDLTFSQTKTKSIGEIEHYKNGDLNTFKTEVESLVNNELLTQFSNEMSSATINLEHIMNAYKNQLISVAEFIDSLNDILIKQLAHTQRPLPQT